MLTNCFLTTCLVALAFFAVNADQYDDKIIYTVFKPDNSSLVWKQGTNLTNQGYGKNGTFAFIIHGYLDSNTTWGRPLANQLSANGQDCVIFVDWGAFSDSYNYGKIILLEFKKIAKAMTRKFQSLLNEGVSINNIFIVGHSLGARLAFLIGEAFGGKIPFIDALEPAGPGYFIEDATMNSRDAAQNVQCIHTSVVLGTSIYDCHQDWLMGYCGEYQCAARTFEYIVEKLNLIPSSPEIETSHLLSIDFYIQAFHNEFLYNNCHNCKDVAQESNLPPRFRMGYMEKRRNSSIIAKIPCATGKVAPFNGNDCCPQTSPILPSTLPWPFSLLTPLFNFIKSIFSFFKGTLFKILSV